MKHFDAAIDSATKEVEVLMIRNYQKHLIYWLLVPSMQQQQQQQQQPPFYSSTSTQQSLLPSQYQQQSHQQPQQQEQPLSNRFNSNFTSLEEMIEENYVGDLNFPDMFYNWAGPIIQQ